jgi:hypothetical protein
MLQPTGPALLAFLLSFALALGIPEERKGKCKNFIRDNPDYLFFRSHEPLSALASASSSNWAMFLIVLPKVVTNAFCCVKDTLT